MLEELDTCPECGSDELRPDVTQGVTDCVNCGWSRSWLDEDPPERKPQES
jgi:transcription initiation factor TFIIIB Brf1 subunit/transcription initiation factor TFIIB